jgi:hypothetical protein
LAIGHKALEVILGPHLTWIHRSLDSITDERILQKLLLRLAQARLPHYAQVRHGPLEYGKDVVALIDRDGKTVLQMYQLKAGDITMKNLPQVKEELDNIFLTDLADVQLSMQPDEREAVLFFNGHINTYAEPVVSGWLKLQRDSLKREVRIMNLDSIVRWIVGGSLINEYRAAASELGVDFQGP